MHYPAGQEDELLPVDDVEPQGRLSGPLPVLLHGLRWFFGDIFAFSRFPSCTQAHKQAFSHQKKNLVLRERISARGDRGFTARNTREVVAADVLHARFGGRYAPHRFRCAFVFHLFESAECDTLHPQCRVEREAQSSPPKYLEHTSKVGSREDQHRAEKQQQQSKAFCVYLQLATRRSNAPNNT